ncbi:hypothetical protein GPA10_04880 [Streptomyces sp. p1417]|uniref:Uncharacterized protein n=1 Tax=Streptomyces typhae TaxID=2681492 RepID=A0A6L6WPZ6_9ACTN|nr:hypothetical protein [Streptomyces typhae]MVO84120.1 hypothetical protein [Streptomyces typhae]
MSPNSPPPGPVRPAAAVNEDIRALWTDPRVGLTHEERARYEHLLIEWIAAERAAQIVIAA